MIIRKKGGWLVGGVHATRETDPRHVREARHEGDVVGTRVRGAVLAHQTGAIHGETHRELLQRHVVHHLVEPANQSRHLTHTFRSSFF